MKLIFTSPLQGDKSLFNLISVGYFYFDRIFHFGIIIAVLIADPHTSPQADANESGFCSLEQSNCPGI